ncbi:MAG TPA: redox-sensing transcriptional repressor Rex [Chloroflexota bacterium]|nr:redox-sensing transcriptional repressor Rex [Chloroflexota bacterium]
MWNPGNEAGKEDVKPRIPPATVQRLPLYVQALKALAREGEELISSQRLAMETGIEAAKIRRDFSYLGAFGTPGVGYAVTDLLHEVSHYLGLSRIWPVALIGYGKLGSALAAYAGFAERNFQIVAIFDSNPQRVGLRVGDLKVLHTDQLPKTVGEMGIDIAIIATPAATAQEAADRLIGAGITSILNFAPTTLAAPATVAVRNIDLAAEMQILSFHETMKQNFGLRYPVQPSMERQVSRWLKEQLQ